MIKKLLFVLLIFLSSCSDEPGVSKETFEELSYSETLVSINSNFPDYSQELYGIIDGKLGIIIIQRKSDSGRIIQDKISTKDLEIYYISDYDTPRIECIYEYKIQNGEKLYKTKVSGGFITSPIGWESLELIEQIRRFQIYPFYRAYVKEGTILTLIETPNGKN